MDAGMPRGLMLAIVAESVFMGMGCGEQHSRRRRGGGRLLGGQSQTVVWRPARIRRSDVLAGRAIRSGGVMADSGQSWHCHGRPTSVRRPPRPAIGSQHFCHL